MAHVDDLPTELLFQIFSSSDLRMLISLRGVSRRWRNVVSVAHINPARRRLLEFYLRVIDSPIFLPTRPHLLPRLEDFDRQDFINRLPPNMPDDFKIWLLEWPAKAVVGWIWPGLRGRPSSEPTDIAIDTRGMNVLGYSAAPYLNKFTLFDPDVERDGLDSAMTHPRSWTSKIWHELEVDSVVVSTIFICWKDPCFASRDWLQYVTAVSKGGEPLLGNVRHFALGDGGCIAKSWAEFLEHELEFEEWDYGGGRFDIAGLFGENE